MNVLVIDDKEQQCETYKRAIRAHFKGFGVSCMCRPDLEGGFAICQDIRFDLVLLDASLENSPPHETVKRENVMRFGCPVIVMSGNDDTTLMDEALANGACDFIIKNTHSFETQMEKIAVVLKIYNNSLAIGPLIHRMRGKPSRVREYLKRNGVPVMAVVISFAALSSNAVGNLWGATKGQWRSDYNIATTLDDHERRLDGLDERFKSQDAKSDRHQKELMDKLGKLESADAASAQERQDLQRMMSEIRQDVRDLRRP